MKYRTNKGDMLDAICHKYYKARPGAMEEVLKANPGLAKVGALLPAGMVIELPDFGSGRVQGQGVTMGLTGQDSTTFLCCFWRNQKAVKSA